MSKITRRNLLKQSPAALAVGAIPASAAAAALPAEAAPSENPDLLAAYARFLAARAEVAAAKDALEWLADEWRHLWPLAPVEILGTANADQFSEHAERDIAGRIIMRDTADLRKQFTAKSVATKPRVCCTVETPERLLEVISVWEIPRTGRTAKALARNRAHQAEVLSQYRHKLAVSEHYHAETKRLREASGVEQVKSRIEAAKYALKDVCEEISHVPAVTPVGLRIKAEALNANSALDVFRGKGILGEMVRFINEALAVTGGASS